MNRKYLILVKFKYAINYILFNQIFHCFLFKSKIHKFEKNKNILKLNLTQNINFKFLLKN